MTKRTTERKAVAPVALRRKSKIRGKMSMQSWTVTGFGVKEETFDKASTDEKIRFIKTYLPKVYEEMQADDMEEVFRKYLDILGITADISRQSVEYYG